MRVFACIVAVAALAAGEDLRPREGSGWGGFRRGSWVKIKRTTAVRGAEPLVTTWTSRLTKTGPDDLTVEMAIKTGVGIEHKTKSVLPRTGEAGAGETQRVEELPDQTVEAAGGKYLCARRRTTVTGPQGKRVIVDWTARRPQVRVKRTVEMFDPAGKPASSLTMTLAALDVKRQLGSRMVRCLEYKFARKQGNREETGKMLSSRQVPGDTVVIDTVTRENKRPVMAMRIEAVEFEAR